MIKRSASGLSNADRSAIDRRSKLRDLLLLRIQEKYLHRHNTQLSGNEVAFAQHLVEDLVFSKTSAPTEKDLNAIMSQLNAPDHPVEASSRKPKSSTARNSASPSLPKISNSENKSNGNGNGNANANANGNNHHQSSNNHGGSSMVSRTMADYVEADAALRGYGTGGSNGPESVTSSVLRRQKDAWACILEKDVEHYKQEQAKSAQKKHEQKIQIRSALDRQLQEKVAKEDVSKKFEAMYAVIEQEQVSDWRNVEERKKLVQKQKDLEVKKMLDVQLELVQNKRLTEIEQRRKEEESELARIKEDLKREAERDKRKKEEKKVEFIKAMEFNVKVLAEREQVAKQEAEYELRLQREYAARLEAQEKARTAAFEKTFARQQRNMQLNAAVQANVLSKAKEDEDRAERQQREMHEKQDRLEAERRARRQAEKDRIRESLQSQVMLREQQKEQEKQDEKRFGQQLRKIGLEEEERRRQAIERKRLQQEKNKNEFARQLEEAKRLKKEFTMTETEKKINKKLLEGVALDDSLEYE
ncbi:mitochondrial TPH domain-containing protein [Andalucia godoyi]|uniref:Mitochondrial TPH domain-containing protein n=1 Tax=Andalucia godoyi TaxID=505711 RepID=A0A8K0AJ65_ANDGO|nr:mitochondrial TPH domain-containing protein [Andalucia godoyi]|eukprot:ANDGO_05936.mRNA.1 mitochondrial TPH domain-containing protein